MTGYGEAHERIRAEYLTAYQHLPDHIRHAIEHALNPNQLETLQLYLEAKTMTPPRGIRWMARELGDIDPSSVSGTLERARRRLHRHGIYQDLNGNWHTERKDDAA